MTAARTTSVTVRQLPAASFLIEGSTQRLVSGLMILIFASALFVTSWWAHRGFGDRIQLHLALNRRERELGEANERLRVEIVQRQQSEASCNKP